jgi:maleate cis-trans isomerase
MQVGSTIETACRIGLLTPYRELPGEYADVVAACRRPALQWQVVTAAADSHEPSELRRMAATEPLADGLRRLRRWRPDLAMWACTSGSFVLGREGALRQCRELSDLAGVPVRSTSVALVAALRALGDDEVALLSPYPEPATAALVEFLAEWGIGVSAVAALGCPGASDSELLTAADLAPRLAALAGSGRVVIPDTATWGFELASALERDGGRAVTTANQVTLWMAFSLLGLPSDDRRFGDLAGARCTDPLSAEGRA